MTSTTERVIVPLEVQRERLFSPDVTTWRRFLCELRRIEDRDVSPASPLLLRMLVRRELFGERPEGSLASFASARVTETDRALGELRRRGVSAASLERTGTQQGLVLGAILRAEDEALGRLRLVDGRAQNGLDGVVLDWPAVDRFVLRAMSDLSHPRIAEIAALAARSEVPWIWELPRLDDAVAVQPMFERLERILGEAHNIEIAWLELPPPPTTLVRAEGPSAEARAVAFSVREALDSGLCPSDIFVVAEPGEATTRYVLALRDASVPVSAASGSPIHEVPEAAAVLSLFEMAATEFHRDKLVALLRTPGLHPGSWVADPNEASAREKAERLASFVEELPILSSADKDLFVELMNERVRGEGAFAVRGEPALSGWVTAALERMLLSIEALRRCETQETLITACLDCTKRLRLGDPSALELHALIAHEESAKQNLGESPLRAAADGAVAVRVISDALHGLLHAARALGLQGARFSPAELVAELREVIANFATGARGSTGRAGAVRVGPPAEALGSAHELVIVTGLVGAAYRPSVDLGLLDAATEARLSPERRPASARERREQVELELLWVARSAKRALLTYSTMDADGHETGAPHPVWLGRERDGASVHSEPASRFHEGASLGTARAVLLTRVRAGDVKPVDLARLRSEERARAAYFAHEGPFGRPWSPDEQRTLFALLPGGEPSRPASVSWVERTSRCRFRSFTEIVLRATTRDSDDDALSRRGRGTLIHALLLEAFERLSAGPTDRPVEDRIASLNRDLLSSAWMTAPMSVLRREAVRQTILEVVRMVRAELALDPEHFFWRGEVEFGGVDAESLPALHLSTSQGELWLRGRIDRVDRKLGGGYRVIDYKTGAIKKSAAGVTDFQLPLYAEAIEVARNEPVDGAYYVVPPGGGLRRVLLDPELFTESGRAAIATTLLGLWSRFSSGDFEPLPPRLSQCESCEARAICRRPRHTMGAPEIA